jgi:predicted amidohydrolase YtcJ
MRSLRRARSPARARHLLCVLAAAALVDRAPAASAPADLVLLDARIVTEDRAHPGAESLAVKDGTIAFVGTREQASGWIGPHTQVVRAGGHLVLPGLVDAHIHPTSIVDFDVCSLDAKALSLAEISTKVHECIVKSRIEPGHWVYVTLWEYGAGNQPDSSHPSLRRALDLAAPANPVDMRGWDGHHGAFNSAGLALAKNASGQQVGFSKATIATDFPSFAGYIGVDENGEPSGSVNDQARQFIDTSEIERNQQTKILAHPEGITALLNSRGITAAQDAAARSNTYEIYDRLLASGRMTVHLNLAQYYRPENFRDSTGRIDYERLFAEADARRRKYAATALVRAEAIKVFADGSIEGDPNAVPPTLGNSPRPVPYLQPIFARDDEGHLTVKGYVDPSSPECLYARAKPGAYATAEQVHEFMQQYGYHPGQCAINYGVPEHAPAIFREYVKQAHLRGYTVHIHAISDAAVTLSIDAIEAARAADGIDSQPDTLAHIEFATPADVKRMGKDHLYLAYTYSWAYTEPTGYDMSLVPFYSRVSGNSYEALHQPDSYFEQTYYPVKTAKDAGAILVAGSDAPVLTKDPQPFVNMEFALTRARPGLLPTSPWQRIGIADIVEAYTINGARALGRSAEIGSLEVGKSADFIVLDRDIMALGPAGKAREIGATRVLQTWFEGRKVYESR